MNKLIIILIILNATLAKASIINGDFKSDLTGWNWTPTIFSEPNMSPMVVDGVFRVNPGTDIEHHSIDQKEGGTLSQSINLVAGTTYEITIGSLNILLQGANNAHAGSIYIYVDNHRIWTWDVEDIIGDGANIYNSYNGTFVPNHTGLHDLKVSFLRTYRNSQDIPMIYHFMDDVSVTTLDRPSLDTNKDGFVDILDYHNFKAQLGGQSTEYSADFNDDGIVNLDDFTIFRGSWHAPEPSSIMILLLGSFLYRRKKND